jgi:hypothetical protein
LTYALGDFMKLFMMAIAGWLAGSVYAEAADYLRPTLTDQDYNWSGYYAGTDFGAVFGDIDVKNDSFTVRRWPRHPLCCSLGPTISVYPRHGRVSESKRE